MSRRRHDPDPVSVSRPFLQAFGLHLVTDLTLPGHWPTTGVAPDRVLKVALDRSIPQILPGASLEWSAYIDGGVLTLERDGAGAVLFRHETGRHLLSPDARSLRCAPADERNPAWFRLLLDPVLTCTALLGGREGLHAGSVIMGTDAVAIVAGSGGGKSTLVAELMKRGHRLVADDITMLEPAALGRPLALPGPPVMTLPNASDHPSQGEVVLDLPGERWVTAPVAHEPAPLRTIIQLERRPRAMTKLSAAGDVLHLLLGALLALPKTPERAVSRLDLASTLATHCDIVTLTADLPTTPAELADHVERTIGAV